jgi:RHS repeat-associated protein
VILLAEHDEPPILAVKKKRQLAPLKTATSTPKNRVWGFANTPSGRLNIEAGSSWENATGSVQYTYQNASGRAEWLSRDPLGENRGINLYEYVANNPVDFVDPLGLAPDVPVPNSTGKIIPGTGDPSYNCMAYGVCSNTWQQPDPGQSPNTVPPKFGCKQVGAGDKCPCHQHKVIIYQDSGDQDNWHVYRSGGSSYSCKYGQCSAYNNIANPTQDYNNVYNPKGKATPAYWCCPGD